MSNLLGDDVKLINLTIVTNIGRSDAEIIDEIAKHLELLIEPEEEVEGIYSRSGWSGKKKYLYERFRYDCTSDI